MGKLVDMIGAEKGREAISYEQWLCEALMERGWKKYSQILAICWFQIELTLKIQCIS